MRSSGRRRGAMAAIAAFAAVLPGTLARATPAHAQDAAAETAVIVTFHDEPGSTVEDVAVEAGIDEVGSAFPGIEAVSAVVDASELAALRSDPRVAAVEPDLPVVAANDSARSSLGIPQLEATYGANGDAAGDGLRTYGPGDVVVAVIDSGINAAHLSLDANGSLSDSARKIRTRRNLAGAACPTDDLQLDWDDSTNGHGTHMAGTIAGDGDVVTGVAPGAALVDLKALCGSTGSQSAVNAALQWVLDNGASWGVDVVSLSLSLQGCGSAGTDSTSRLANQVVAAGFTVVAAVGNASACLAGAPGQVTAPGAARHVVGVGAATEPAPSWGVAGFSLHGPTADGRVKPDVIAPGVSITSSHGSIATATNTLQGTSSATAVVAAIAGMLVEVNPDMRPRGSTCAACGSGVDDGSMVVPVLDLLRATALDILASGPDEASGYGVVRPQSAMAAIIPVGHLDSVTAATVGTAVVQGWAIDSLPSRAVEIHVYVNGAFAGFGLADQPRPDLVGLYPTSGPNHGFSLGVPVSPGTSSVCAFAIDDANPNRSRFLGCRSITVATGPPFGNVETTARIPGGVLLQGWAIDPDTTAPIEVDLWSAGRFLGWGVASGSRPDVAAAFGYGPNHGFSVAAAIGPGSHVVCAYGINVGGGTSRAIGCPTVSVTSTPIGNIDFVSRSGGTVRVQGWALDFDQAGPIEVHLLVDGQLQGYGMADGPRSDIAATFPAYGANHGFSVAAPIASGSHQVCVYGINVSFGFNTELRCASI